MVGGQRRVIKNVLKKKGFTIMLHVTDLSNPTIHNRNIPEPKKLCASLFSKKYSHCNGNSFLNHPVQPLRPDVFYNSYFNFGF